MNYKDFCMICGEINSINENIVKNYNTELNPNFIIHKHFIYHLNDINESFDSHYSPTPLYICSMM